MADLLSKILAVILAFMLLILAPVVLFISVDDAAAQREALNDTAAFVDKIRDQGFVSQNDIDMLNASVNSHGLVLDTEVVRQVRAIIQDAAGELETVYIAIYDLERMKSFAPGDLVQVRVYEPVTSFNARFLRRVLGFAMRPVDIQFAGVVK